MLTKLMQINSTQSGIIETQAGIINELFLIVCEHVNLDELEGLEPLLTSMRDAAEKTQAFRE